MKLFLLTVLLLSTQVFAQGGGDRVGAGLPVPPLITIEQPGSPMMLNPVSRTISVFANGRVVSFTQKRNSRTGEVSSSSKLMMVMRDLSEINRCVSQLDQVRSIVPNYGYCQDDPGTHYTSLYDKKFAVQYCGKLQVVNVSCAKRMITILNSLMSLSRN